jgi:hypothetical protein
MRVCIFVVGFRVCGDPSACAGEVVVDEEEFRIMKQLVDVKKEYRALFNEVRTIKGGCACMLPPRAGWLPHPCDP